jgi:hypothetical protein
MAQRYRKGSGENSQKEINVFYTIISIKYLAEPVDAGVVCLSWPD